MKLLFFLLFASLLSRGVVLGQGRPIQRIDGSTIAPPQLDSAVTRLMSSARVTGLGLAVFNKNRVVYQKAFGLSNADRPEALGVNTIFYGASLSKAVFAVLVLQLVEEGVISLDTPLQQYLRKPLPAYSFPKTWQGYADLRADQRYEVLTARMCLTHTTGLPNWRFLTSQGYAPAGKLYFQFAPGARYSYSGEGLSLLQFVLEQRTGQGLEEMAQERIFQPLGMTRTSYVYVWPPGRERQYAYGHDAQQHVLPKDEVDEAGAAGSMGTTLADYSKFLAAVLQGKLLKKASYRELFRQQVAIRSQQQFGPQALVETTDNEAIQLGYGLGWGVLATPYGRGAFKEGGSEGYQHYSILFPEQDAGVLIMTNSDNADGILKELLEQSIGDTFTPWQWENYVPYDNDTNKVETKP